MKLGFCHLGFWVCSERHVWYVTERPSEEEEEEKRRGRGGSFGGVGPRTYLKARLPTLPTEWGVYNQLGSEASSLCFYYWLCVQAERRLLCLARLVAKLYFWGAVGISMPPLLLAQIRLLCDPSLQCFDLVPF